MKQKITLAEFRKLKKQFDDLLANTNEENDQIRLIRDELLSYDLSNIPYKEWNDSTIITDDLILNNPTSFLGDSFSELPEEVKDRFNQKQLTINDFINYKEVLNKIPVDNFMTNNVILDHIKNNYGIGQFQKLVFKHPDVFGKLQEENLDELIELFDTKRNLEDNFAIAVKKYFLHDSLVTGREARYQVEEWRDIPEFLSSMDYRFVETLEGFRDFERLDEVKDFLADSIQRHAIDLFGLDNIRRFDSESYIFDGLYSDYDGEDEYGNYDEDDEEYYDDMSDSDDWQMFDEIAIAAAHLPEAVVLHHNIDFKNGTLPYDEFEPTFLRFLKFINSRDTYENSIHLNRIEWRFADKYPEIFVPKNAPVDLKEIFYENQTNPRKLFNRPEFIPYLIERNLVNTIRCNLILNTSNIESDYFNRRNQHLPDSKIFLEEYIARHGNEKALKLFCKYGEYLDDLIIDCSESDLEDEEKVEKAIRKAIYKSITSSYRHYLELADIPEFVSEYPDVFISLDSLKNISQKRKSDLQQKINERTLTFEDVKNNPQIIPLLKDKNLYIPFGHMYNERIMNNYWEPRDIAPNEILGEIDLIRLIGNEDFLKLCSEYGRYFEKISEKFNKEARISNGRIIDIKDVSNGINYLSLEDIEKRIQDIIFDNCYLGETLYNPDDCPKFLREDHPEIFLNDDAPELLKDFFYGKFAGSPLTFEVLQEHKDWIPYLKDKFVAPALYKGQNYFHKEIIKYFESLGNEDAIKFGMNKLETVKAMLNARQTDKLKFWYDKTGGKFLPDVVVMQNFDLDEADKFLESGANWSKLMKIDNFAKKRETRDAMLKLAYSFGAFDHDQKGFKQLQSFLVDIPKKIDGRYARTLKTIDNEISISSAKDQIFKQTKSNEEGYNKIIDHIVKNNSILNLHDTETLISLFESLKEEYIGIDFSEDILKQIYRENEDGSYTLTFNQQNCPKSTKAIRKILEQSYEVPMMTPNKAHQLFGSFKLKYDPNFREFLLSNMDQIYSEMEYGKYISSIQKQFDEIRAYNSNRTLTLDLAISFVQSNKYTDVEIGNEKMAEVSSIAGYSQKDFEKLQEIYNYGKQRAFSSIPRIEKSTDKYKYEILRLDDPFALAIGSLTDCCQTLGNAAELCMEHSMVDKNGRVFVIRDLSDNILAQSWIWRNKNVLCFDNIEVPNKALYRADKENAGGRKELAEEIYQVYKDAAKELIQEDEKMYKELLDSGKITEEQYNGLKLRKVTVGLGYNDITGPIKKNSNVDEEKIARPLHYEPSVLLESDFYTNDSRVQYVLEKTKEEIEYDGETLPVHSDTYIEYDDHNFKEKNLRALERLSMETNDEHILSQYSLRKSSGKDLVTKIAESYELNPETTKVIMHPNFAIIYDTDGNKLRVGELLFNTEVKNGDKNMNIEDKVAMQIKLAFNQISKDKNVDVSMLNKKQKDMYNKAIILADEVDVERGVGHAK